MSVTSSSHEPGKLARYWSVAQPWLGQALLWLAVFLALLKLPAPPSSGLDPSWRMVIGYALGHGMQWGTDIVFTYGPLGYLLAATNHGANYGDFLIWQAVSNVIFTTVIWLVGRSFRGWRLAAYYAYFLFFVANYLDAMHMTIILLLGLAALRESVARRKWLVGLVGVMLAVLALIKFTNLMLAGFAVGCVSVHHAYRRRWPDLAVVAGSFGVSFLGGWLICGQSLANLPAYLLYSLNASSGYGDGMSLYEDNLTFALGLASAGLVGAYYVVSLWRREDLPRALAAMLIVAAGSFMNWKHGFSRADGHVFAHYIACLLVPVTFPVLLMDDGPLRRWKAGLLTATAIVSLWGIYLCAPYAITDGPAAWNYQLKATVNALRILPDLKRNARAEFDTVAKPHLLPATKTIVGDDTIDMLGNEQAFMLFNRFNYRPRPVFQTYLPYTAELLRLNEDFFKSPRAPKYVLQKMDTIDYRLPALEDSLAALYIYHHYDFVTEERGMLLWRRNDQDPARDEKTLIAESTAAFGGKIVVPNRGETPVWAEVEVSQSLLGRARAFLYKAPLLSISLTEGSDFKSNYRIVRSMATAGFLIYPHFSSGYNIQRYMGGDAAPRADSFSIEMPADDQKYFQPDIKVRFYELKPLTRTKGIATGSPEEKFRVFSRVPEVANALYPMAILQEGSKEVLFAHPPSNIEFQVNFPASRVTGRFGMAEKAYTAPNATDGAEFIVEWLGADGHTVTLFSRLLRPVSVAEDQGMQAFDVAIPSGGGRLILRITPGPNGNLAFDWSYWTDVKFVP